MYKEKQGCEHAEERPREDTARREILQARREAQK